MIEKLKLLEAKQAVEYAQTDLEYRKIRIASLLQSLKEETDAQNQINTTSAITNVPSFPAIERRLKDRSVESGTTVPSE